MIKILRWMAAVPLIVAAVLFALAHAQPVQFHWSPVNDPLTLPLYILALGLCAVGFVIGAVATWLGMGRIRRDRRHLKKTVRQLEKDLAATHENLLRAREENLNTPASSPQIGPPPHVH